jgi:hypothetical protein
MFERIGRGMNAKRRNPKAAGRRRKAQRVKKAAAPAALEPQDLQPLNPGLFGVEEAAADRPNDESMQDPLQDWPEAEGAADEWLRDRGGRKDEDEQR